MTLSASITQSQYFRPSQAANFLAQQSLSWPMGLPQQPERGIAYQRRRQHP